ncbi:MAG: hypothetical protein M3Y74_09950, partial [Chloroflexota bacterium]|nr:hypothetical protein [Chloroflexota bacterium]
MSSGARACYDICYGASCVVPATARIEALGATRRARLSGQCVAMNSILELRTTGAVLMVSVTPGAQTGAASEVQEDTFTYPELYVA